MTSPWERGRADLRRARGFARRVSHHRLGEQVEPDLPPGRAVELPGRGHTFVREVGVENGFPVVLLHGWTLNSDLNWFGSYGPLGEKFRVLAQDVRFHGRGIRPVGPFRSHEATDDAIALLDVLGIEKAVIAGFSLGGVLAVDAAVRHPDRVAGIVVESSAACYHSMHRDRLLWWAVNRMKRALSRDPEATFGPVYFTDSLRTHPDLAALWSWVREESHRMKLVDVLAVAEDVRRVDFRPVLADGVRCPSEYILLTRDRVCRPALQRELAALLGAHITEVAADHDFPVAAPEMHAQALSAAVSRVVDRFGRATSLKHGGHGLGYGR